VVAFNAVLGLAAATSWLIACSSQPASAPRAPVVIGDAGPESTPIEGVSQDFLQHFVDGENDFVVRFQPADGLGPLYIQQGCIDCHTKASRGPGHIAKMVAVDTDGVSPLADQNSFLPFGNTERPVVVLEIPGAKTPILPPLGADGGVASDVRVSKRIGPPIFGRGYMEAVDDATILMMEAQQASAGDGLIHGHANHVVFVSQPNPDSTFDSYKTGDTVIGRFGLKAKIATIDEFDANALQGDLGITSPMRPTELPNPDGITDDLRPGIDVTADLVNDRAMYVRLLAIPDRVPFPIGFDWFESCDCSVCHAPTMHTRADYPIPQLANIDAPIYTDLLLHDMGDGLSDSVAGGDEGQAGPRDWRTAPLIGERFNISFLHDGRAMTIMDAILAHDSPGSEASRSTQCFEQLSSVQQQQLIQFVNGL
jgi:CxxC motif-containing protein (DUF1111 family)